MIMAMTDAQEMNTPREFFEGHVKPSYADWLAAPLAEYKAKFAVSEANNMAERLYHYLRAQNHEAAGKGASDYRRRLVRGCVDFQLVWDVADAHKHLRLDRGGRRVSNANQTRPGVLTYDVDVTYDEANFSYLEAENMLIVTADDMTQRPLKVILANVILMYEKLLGELGI